MYSPQKFHESCTKLSTETTPPGRSIGQNNRATTPSHLTTNPVTTTALITSRRCDSPVIDPPLPSPLFWSTAKTKTANNETQIYAKVASKSVVVTESSVRSDLQFNDEDEQLSDIPSSSQPQKTQKHRKGRKLSNRVLDLEKAMTAQAKEIAILKKRVKKLEKRKRSRTQGLKLFKIGTSKRRSLDKEGASKNRRNLNAMLISEEDNFDARFDVVRDEGITHVKGDAKHVVITAAEVVNAGVSVSTAEPKTPPTTITTLLEDDEVTSCITPCVDDVRHQRQKSIVLEDVEEILLRN
ncbi:hypothetical protein Tco_0103212 [Tanacetum coccineum]